jgi:exonuclease SbcD
MTPASPVKILFVGDMHLGRRASRIPDNAWDLGGFKPADLSPLGAWRRVVETAIEKQVQAVALAGDLVHQDDDLFEARAHLERGIRQLNEAGIAVVAVAGNHDTRVLPALARVIEGLHLLGAGGTWGTITVAEGVRLVGWSFPARHHTTSPLQQPAPKAEAGVVSLGLLHADRDVARSNYAPVTSGELNMTGYQGWALGHIHVPDPVPDAQAPRRPFYLGSITGAIPTETGAHGPALASISAGGEVQWERLILAPLRWEHLTVAVDDLTATDSAADLGTHLRNHLLEKVSAFEPGSGWDNQNARALGLRLTLTGAHRQADALQRAAAEFTREELVTLKDGCVVFIEKITSQLTVPVDLETLARRNDPPGLVAREILALRDEDPATAPLLAQARLAVAQVAVPAGLAAEAWSDDDLRGHLIEAGQRALNALLQKDGGQTP